MTHMLYDRNKKKESKMRKRKQKRTNNRKKKKNRKEERERKQGKANGGMHIISVRVYQSESGSVCTCLSYANNCSDDSGIFQSFKQAVTTARNDRSNHHVTDNETAAHHNIIKPSQSAYYLITKRL